MLNSRGTAYAATADQMAKPIPTRFVLWFNGNGIVEKYWIPRQDGKNYDMTPCLQPLARFRNDIHILSGVDNPAARIGAGNGHHNSMSGLVAGESFSGRGAGGPSIDQVIANQIGLESRFRSLQIGVCQESFGESTAAEARLIRGFVLNRFRGDASLLAPGPQMLERLTGVPTLAVLPMWRGHGLPEEDGVFDDPSVKQPGLQIAVVAYPRISNLDEFQPLRNLPGVSLRWAARSPSHFRSAHALQVKLRLFENFRN